MTTMHHATTVAIGGRAVMIFGASGSGKSDLGLRLIDRGAVLIADDRTSLTVEENRLIARCPATIAGLLEVRGIGIVTVPHRDALPVVLIVALSAIVARMPEPATRTIDDVTIPLVTLDARDASAAIKVELALARIGEPG